MTQDMTDVTQAIGKLQGTVETEHEHTRKQVSELFDRVNNLTREGCNVGKEVKGRITVLEKKVLILGFLMASIMGIDKVITKLFF